MATPRRALDAFFTDQARKYPTRTALVVGEESCTYEELERQAAAIELTLRNARLSGATPVVGLAYARSTFSYAAVLGIMRSGCVYVPLNPKAPAERLLKIIADARIDAVIVDTSEGLSEGVQGVLSSERRVRIVVKDPAQLSPLGPEVLSALSVHWVPADADVAAEPPAPAALAYIIYTSGSTGEPKGVPVTHESACRCIERMQALFETHEKDRFTQFSALSFDYSLVELFLCWKSGGGLYVPSAANALVPFDFANKHAITIWSSVPALCGFMLKLGLLKPGSLPSIRMSLLGGEALPFDLAHAWGVAASRSRVINLYGPTEVTIVSTYYECRPEGEPATGTVPIGYVLPGLRWKVMDDGEPVREGEPGELWLAGDQVVSGYWNNPTATASAFVQTFSAKGEETWYRTGDVVTHRSDVGLTFRGRIDRQVKLRGLRIELQEIESVLREVTGCALVAVIPVHGSGGLCEKIIAYCDNIHDEAAVKALCLRRLPSYMVPERIYELSTFPVSAHGKIDYRKLVASIAV